MIKKKLQVIIREPQKSHEKTKRDRERGQGKKNYFIGAGKKKGRVALIKEFNRGLLKKRLLRAKFWCNY